jgi:single-stranded-DNA-specific exonuclease
MIEVEVVLMQPDRMQDGYGLHNSSIDQAIELGVTLMITVDCGITAHQQCSYAQKRGVEIIITDHHQDELGAPNDALATINPNRKDELETNQPLKALAGVGVAFALALGIKEELERQGRNIPSIYPLLQFVAIGTICDLANLNPLNRLLVRHGIRQLANTSFPGIAAFFSPQERKLPISTEKLSFQIGPMINSKGRVDHPKDALSMLIAPDAATASSHLLILQASNEQRKGLQREVGDAARSILEQEMSGGEQEINIVYHPSWHEGVIGIVASKLVDSFKLPAIVLTNSQEEGVIKGSARSAGELDLFATLSECSDLFIKFGGHKKAAGLSMNIDNLDAFKQSMKHQLQKIPYNLRSNQDLYEMELNYADITPKLVRDLELLEPLGQGNERPIFFLRNVKISSFDILKDLHVRWNFAPTTPADKKGAPYLKGISFNYIGGWNKIHPQELFSRQQRGEQDGVSIYFTLGINRWNGREDIQLMVKKVE